MKLNRYKKNPILSPDKGSDWESAYTCNPAAWHDGNKFHLLYRTGPDNDLHPIYLGHAESDDGFTFKRTGDKPVFGPSEDGFDAGCIEDPRVIKMGDAYYLTYAARIAPPGPYWKKTMPLNVHIPDYMKNGNSPNAAKWNLTRSGIAVTRDFKNWIRLGPVTDARVDDRDAILFPERVGGRFAMLHRPAAWVGEEYGCENPSIWMTLSDDLLHWEEEYLLAKPEQPWESMKIGGSTTPIRTDKGWLTIYHGVDEDFIYRAGALLLDLDDPRRILARTPEPILEPEEPYELKGVVPNVVFPCGNVVVDDILYVYYGAADTHCAVATAPLKEFIDDLAKEMSS